jgi:hypothetical protein
MCRQSDELMAYNAGSDSKTVELPHMSWTDEFMRSCDASSKSHRRGSQGEQCQSRGFRNGRSRTRGRRAAELPLPCEKIDPVRVAVGIGVARQVRRARAEVVAPPREIIAVDVVVFFEVGREAGPDDPEESGGVKLSRVPNERAGEW